MSLAQRSWDFIRRDLDAGDLCVFKGFNIDD